MNAEIHVLDHRSHLLEPSHYYRMRFTPGAHSARHVRRIVRAYVIAWGMAPLSEVAELGVTELLANVVKHVPDSLCTMLLRRRERGVRVEVHDSDPALPRLRQAADWDEDGRGLALLDLLPDAWAAERTGPRTKMVWFELYSATEDPG
ncbi:hypothetical protein N566_02485 [Streptomycetaceae bacterium MP113-05]|nr:hypothetical protein N566_02485 [Streptomycetaceae bacterium MP113-05]